MSTSFAIVAMYLCCAVFTLSVVGAILMTIDGIVYIVNKEYDWHKKVRVSDIEELHKMFKEAA